MHGWDQSQARLFEAICRHTALAALAQLRAAAIRGALDGSITLPAAGPAPDRAHGSDRGISDAEPQIPLGDAPVPDRGGLPCPAGIAPIRLSIAETIRLTVLARQHAAGLITRARLAFALRWSPRRRRRRPPPAGTTTAPGCWPPGQGNKPRPKEVTQCNRTSAKESRRAAAPPHGGKPRL